MPIGIGVEIGPSGLHGVVLERSGQDLTLRAAQEVACDPSSAEALTRALILLRQSLPISGPIVLGVPSASAILETVVPLIVNPRRAELAVRFELQHRLPFDLTEAAWHYRWLSGDNGASKAAGVPRPDLVRPRRAASGSAGPLPGAGAVVAAMRQSLLDERLSACRRAGVAVRAVAVNPVAMLNAWQRSRDAAGVSALLHVMDAQAAEWILSTPAALRVFPVSSPSSEAFEQELVASWEAFRSQVPALPTTVQVAGQPAAIPSLPDVLQARLGLTLVPVDAERLVAKGGHRLTQPQRALAAMGLALQALGLARLPLNLLAHARLHQRSARVTRTAMLASGLFLCAIVGLAVSGMIEARQRRALLLQELERRERLYQSLRPEVRALLQRQQHLQERSRQLEEVARASPLVTQVLVQISEALPDDVWVTRVECSKHGLLEGLIEGRARSFQSVTTFMERLKSDAGMTTVKPLSTRVTGDQEGEERDQVAFAVKIQRPVASDGDGSS